MFPDIRSALAALLASIVGILCGLALFAAFRVNREPFAHDPNGGVLTPLAFAAPPPTVADRMDRLGVPFGVRFQVKEPIENGLWQEVEKLPEQAPAPAAPESPVPGTKDDKASAVALESPPVQTPPAEAKPAATTAPAVAPHRVARVRRLRRRQAVAPAQTDNQFPQPFGTAPTVR